MGLLDALKKTVEGSVFTGFEATPKLRKLVGEKTAKVIATVASHPFTTAAAVATAFNPTAAINVGKAVGGKVASSFASAPLKTQAIAVGGGLVGAGALIKNPGLAVEVSKAPGALVNVGGNIGEFIENPTAKNAKDIFTENPLASTLLGGVAVVGAGVSAGALGSTLATYQNTQAVKKNTSAFALISNVIPSDKIASTALTPTSLKQASAGTAPPLLETSEKPGVPAETIKKDEGVRQSQKVTVYTAPVQYNRKVYKHNHTRRRKC